MELETPGYQPRRLRQRAKGLTLTFHLKERC
jgi:hypothetical protein